MTRAQLASPLKTPKQRTFSVVISTLGRSQELTRLLESLERQSLQTFEVIVVDQNDDDRVATAIGRRPWQFPITHIRTPQQRGLSRARNVGWREARGLYVVFADDDCWYPPALLTNVEVEFRRAPIDIVGGRSTDETGRSINGRFEMTPQLINRANVWTTSIEWMLFFRRGALERLGGFDETIGVGASTPWQSAEGQDILLRALHSGLKCKFDPSLWGHHPELDIVNPDGGMCRKARAYGRGMGYVLKRHGYGILSVGTWIGRPSAAMLVYVLRGQTARGLYYFNMARGRLEGWLQSA